MPEKLPRLSASNVEVFLIAAVDRRFGIGKEGALLFHLRQDMMRFYQKTKNAVVVMGRKTFESLPAGGLRGRHHVVITSQQFSMINMPADFNEDITLVSTPDLALKAAKRIASYTGENKVAVIGGEAVYRDLLIHCDAAYLTHIWETDDHADTFFPAYEFFQQFDPNPTQEFSGFEGDVAFSFYTYRSLSSVFDELNTQQQSA